MEKIVFAHKLRAFAALLVCFSHLCCLFWTGRIAVLRALGFESDWFMQVKTPYLLRIVNSIPMPDAGMLGVAIFFLISGFVIPFSLERLSVRNFLVARFFRIYPLYWIAFLLVMLSVFFVQSRHPSLVDFVRQALLLRDWAWIPSLDLVSWSLEIEIKFYILCALAAPLLRAGRLLPLILAVSGLFVLMLIAKGVDDASFLRWNMVLQYDAPVIIFMCCGVILNFLYRKKIGVESAVISVMLVFLFACFSFALSDIYAQFSSKYFISYGLAFIFFGLCYRFRASFPESRIISYIADISYPLYLVHAVISFVLIGLLLKLGLNSYLAILIAFMTVLGIAALLHILEVYFIKTGKRFMKETPPVKH